MINWATYDASLRAWGSLTVWFTAEAIEAWKAEPRTGWGGQPRYSDLATSAVGGRPHHQGRGMGEFASMRSHGTAVAVWTIWTGMLLTAVSVQSTTGATCLFGTTGTWFLRSPATSPSRLLALVAAQRASCASPANTLLGREPFHGRRFPIYVYFDVFPVAGTAAAMMLIARRLRGRTA